MDGFTRDREDAQIRGFFLGQIGKNDRYPDPEINMKCEGAERGAEIQAARLRIEARQWYSKVTSPRKYSERLAVDQRTEHRPGGEEMSLEQARAILQEHGLDPDSL